MGLKLRIANIIMICLPVVILCLPASVFSQDESDKLTEEQKTAQRKANAQKYAQATKVQQSTDQANASSQKKIDTNHDAKQTMLEEYRMITAQNDSLKVYNEQLSKLVGEQQKELDGIAKKIEEIQHTHRDVVPLMLDMLKNLESFVSLDIPFLEEERRNRLDQLQVMMDRADVSTSEKFRRVLEAYQIENEYGRTIEAYNGDIEMDGGKKTVEFLRVGRLALIYQTLDGKNAYTWDNEKRGWQPLGDEYRKAISDGLRIARKQMAPDLMSLPIPNPQKAEMTN